MTIIFVIFYGSGYGITVQWERGLGRELAPPQSPLPRKNIT